jgi:signal peptidase II
MDEKRLSTKHWILIAILPLVFILDQGTKTLVDRIVSLHDAIPVIPGFFNITHVENTGAAFGLFSGNTNTPRTLFFTAITVGALVLIYTIFRRVRGDRVLVPLSLAMIMSGALGNLVDRIRWGYVIDFLDFYWGVHHWPAFNIADSSITVGVCLLLLENLFSRKTDQPSVR